MSEPENHPDDPYAPHEAPPSPREKPMGFWEHLEELRGTLIKSAVVFAVFAGLIGFYLKEFNEVLLWPFLSVKTEYPDLVLNLGAMTIMEPFSIIIQMCVMGSLLLSAPFILFFVGQFVAPALTEKELKAVLPMCGSALVLFLLGAAFSFFILMPSTLRVSIELSNLMHLEFRWTAASYYSFLTILVLGVGASFEFPLVIVLLVWLGVVTTAFLRKYRRHAIVVIFIIAAIVTPTPDPLNQALFAAPLYVLYEIAIIASSRVEKRRERRLAQG